MRHSSLICGKARAFAPIWSKFWCTREFWAYLHDRSSTAYLPIPFGNQNRLRDIEYLCQNMSHRLTYSWQSHSFCWHIIEVWAHLWSAFQRFRSWETARVFFAQMPLLLLGLSWPMSEDHSQLRSSILCRMSFLDMYEANFDKLWIIMDVIVKGCPLAAVMIHVWVKQVHVTNQWRWFYAKHLSAITRT